MIPFLRFHLLVNQKKRRKKMVRRIRSNRRKRRRRRKQREKKLKKLKMAMLNQLLNSNLWLNHLRKFPLQIDKLTTRRTSLENQAS
jgi:hypothetical protein